MGYVASSVRTGTGASAVITVAVPAEIQENDIVIFAWNADSSGATGPTYNASLAELHQEKTATDGHFMGVAWKRAGAAESGNYTATLGGGVTPDWAAAVVLFRARHLTNPPTASEAESDTGNTTPVSINAATVTALDGDDLCWISSPDVTASGVGNGHTPPTDYTERADVENAWANLSIATRDNVSAGATGTVTGTFALTGSAAAWVAYLVRIPSDGTGGGGISIPVVMHHRMRNF